MGGEPQVIVADDPALSLQIGANLAVVFGCSFA